jgi:hypothetical protein
MQGLLGITSAKSLTAADASNFIQVLLQKLKATAVQSQQRSCDAMYHFVALTEELLRSYESINIENADEFQKQLWSIENDAVFNKEFKTAAEKDKEEQRLRDARIEQKVDRIDTIATQMADGFADMKHELFICSKNSEALSTKQQEQVELMLRLITTTELNASVLKDNQNTPTQRELSQIDGKLSELIQQCQRQEQFTAEGFMKLYQDMIAQSETIIRSVANLRRNCPTRCVMLDHGSKRFLHLLCEFECEHADRAGVCIPQYHHPLEIDGVKSAELLEKHDVFDVTQSSDAMKGLLVAVKYTLYGLKIAAIAARLTGIDLGGIVDEMRNAAQKELADIATIASLLNSTPIKDAKEWSASSQGKASQYLQQLLAENNDEYENLKEIITKEKDAMQGQQSTSVSVSEMQHLDDTDVANLKKFIGRGGEYSQSMIQTLYPAIIEGEQCPFGKKGGQYWLCKKHKRLVERWNATPAPERVTQRKRFIEEAKEFYSLCDEKIEDLKHFFCTVPTSPSPRASLVQRYVTSCPVFRSDSMLGKKCARNLCVDVLHKDADRPSWEDAIREKMSNRAEKLYLRFSYREDKQMASNPSSDQHGEKGTRSLRVFDCSDFIRSEQPRGIMFPKQEIHLTGLNEKGNESKKWTLVTDKDTYGEIKRVIQLYSTFIARMAYDPAVKEL